MADPRRVAAALQYQQQTPFWDFSLPSWDDVKQAGSDAVTGISRLPYRVLGAPVDLTNMVTSAFGTGDQKPVGGSEWMIDKAINAGLAKPRSGSVSESVGDFTSGLIDPSVMGPKLAAALAKTAPTAQAMFIGARSKAWNAENAAKAIEMEKAGIAPEKIWEQTGTWRGPDKELRQEISDRGTPVTDDVFDSIKASKEFHGPIVKALKHQELFKAYPQLEEYPSSFFASATPSGSHNPNTKSLLISGPDTVSQRSVALHELQHAIQNQEGWAVGGSPENIGGITSQYSHAKGAFDNAVNVITNPNADEIAKSNARQIMSFYGPKLRKLKEVQDPQEAYKRLAGEAEARATQKRRNMTDEERRAQFPPTSYDVPIEDLIRVYR